MNKFNPGDIVQLSPEGKNIFPSFVDYTWKVLGKDDFYSCVLIGDPPGREFLGRGFAFTEEEIQLVDKTPLEKHSGLYREVREGRGDKLEFTLFRLTMLEEADWTGRKRVLQDLLDGKHDF